MDEQPDKKRSLPRAVIPALIVFIVVIITLPFASVVYDLVKMYRKQALALKSFEVGTPLNEIPLEIRVDMMWIPNRPAGHPEEKNPLFYLDRTYMTSMGAEYITGDDIPFDPESHKLYTWQLRDLVCYIVTTNDATTTAPIVYLFYHR